MVFLCFFFVEYDDDVVSGDFGDDIGFFGGDYVIGVDGGVVFYIGFDEWWVVV